MASTTAESNETDHLNREAAGDAANARLARFAGQLNVVNAQLVAEVAELLENGLWRQGAMTTPAGFVAWKLGLSPARARTIVSVAERRAEFPVVIGMFDRGEVSLEQVAEAVRAPAWADAKIADLVAIATPAKLRRAFRTLGFEGDPDEPESAVPPRRDRVSFGIGRDGRWHIRGEFGIDDGRRIEAALTERKDALFHDDESVTLPEAFVDCFDRSLRVVPSSGRRDRYRTWFHFDVTEGELTTTDGWRVPMAVHDRLLCDGVIQPVWEREGVPFGVGRSQHVVPDRTRRIVERRDRGCRVPGCDRSRFVEIHHIIHWLDGGPTDTWNLISLCPKHHKMHHQGGLGITGNADEFGSVVFTDEAGRRIAGCGPPTPPTESPPASAEPYRPPIHGRFDWNWIGLGWSHPKAVERRKQQLASQYAGLDGPRQAA